MSIEEAFIDAGNYVAELTELHPGDNQFTCLALEFNQKPEGMLALKLYEQTMFPGMVKDAMRGIPGGYLREELQKDLGREVETCEVNEFRVLLMAMMAACWRDMQ